MIGRVSTFGLGESMLRSAMTIQAKMAEKQLQSSSELAAETYAGLSASAGRLVSLETSLSRAASWADNTQIALDRTNAMYDSVGSMIDKLTELRATLSQARSDATDSVDYGAVGALALEDLESLMNLQMDGCYLFAGSRSDTAPVDRSALATPSQPSSADLSYYTGDSEGAEVRTSAQQTIAYGVTADGEAFEKALRAANLAACLDGATTDEDTVTEAYDLATEALDALLVVQGRLSLTAGRLEDSLSAQGAQATLVSEMISDIKSVDVTTVTVEIAQYETALQASYAALGKVTALSLVDYL